MINNSIVKKASKEQAAIFNVNGAEVKLTPQIVKNYLVSGNADKVTDQEIAMFINLCKYSGLNPWVKEAYCIKYGNSPATMVVGKEAFIKRAEANKNFDGSEAGIIVQDQDGNIDYRKGTLHLDNEEVIGGYAEVWRKDRTHSTRIEVSFKEYAGYTSDGKLNSNWSKRPATMIRKVALVQALREAFPSSFGGMYTAEEQGIEEPQESVVMPQEELKDIEVIENTIAEEKEQTKADNVQQALFS